MLCHPHYSTHDHASSRRGDPARYRKLSEHEPMTMYLWLKALHIIFVVTWFAGLFYIPRLFIYHSSTTDQAGKERFKVMERKLYRVIMNPSMILTLVFGTW